MKLRAPTLPLTLLAATAILAGGCGPRPCTDCPDVGGSYELVLQGTPKELSSCGQITWNDDSASVTLDQAGSMVTISEWRLSGTLYEDWSISFPAFPDVTVENEPGETVITGAFSTDLSSYRGDLEFEFTRDRDRCVATAPATLLLR